MHVPEPVLTNAPRIEQLVHEGRLELSVQDAISLALQNNLDISVQRYAPLLAETTVLLAKTQGSFPGLFLDPQATSNLFWDRRSIPINNPFISGTGVVLSSINTNTAQYNFQYQQGFTSGTNYAVAFDNTRSSSSNPANLLNPSVEPVFSVAFSQPLLNGLGFFQNRAALYIARYGKTFADLTFQQQLITSIAQVATQYWELVFSREDVQVQQENVALAQKLYDDNMRQMEIGTLAHLDVTRAEAQLESAKASLIASQTNQLQQQQLLKNLITKNPLDPLLLNVEIVPTDIPVEPKFDVIPIQDAVQEALTKRPDVLQGKTTLLSDDINARASRRALLPQLNITGQYTSTGLAGNSKTFGPSVADGLSNAVVDSMGNVIGHVQLTTTPIVGTSQGGWFDALSTVFKNQFPDYNLGVNLTIPIRNRAAQATHTRALLQERQDEVKYRQVQNQVVVDIRNAQIALTQDHAQIASAQKARALSEETLDAEQKKLQLGASTVFMVISDQQTLAAARETEIRSMINMIEAKITFDRVMGRTLEINNVTIADARNGQIQRDNLIPGTPANGDIVGEIRDAHH